MAGNGNGERWFSARDLAGLPGMPRWRDAVVRIAGRRQWPSRPRRARGGGREYPFSCIPQETREAILARSIERIPDLPAISDGAVPAAAPAAAPTALPSLCDWQRRRLEARLSILSLVDELGASCGVDAAIREVVDLAALCRLPAHIQALIPSANMRRGASGARLLSSRSIYRWLAKRAAGNAALAPRAKAQRQEPPWAPQLLALYRRPQKPCLSEVVELLPQALPEGIPVPSYWAARRYLDRTSPIEKNRGRMGPLAIKAIRPFRRRDLSKFLPLDIVLIDGHTFDAEVAHPVSGRPFRPEHTEGIDAVTRKVIGWSIRLAESTWVVIDTIRHGAVSHGLFNILYVDRGSAYESAAMSDAVIGFLSRLGIRKESSLPYNSQARGLIERLHQSLWVRLAKTYPTYVGAPMDPQAKKLAHKIVRGKVAGRDPSSLLPSWAAHIKASTAAVAAYNARPHRGLPRILDPGTGKMRHMSPNEAWAHFEEKGFVPRRVSTEEEADFFRPYDLRIVQRGEIKLFSNCYFSRALEHHHGQQVRVGYDIHDASKVWVRDLEGRLICEAMFEANKGDYFPVSRLEQIDYERTWGRVKRLEKKLAAVRADYEGPAEIAVEPETPSPAQIPPPHEPLSALCAPPPEEDDPVDDDVKWARWANAHRNELSGEQREYLDARIEGSAALRDLLGLSDHAECRPAPAFASPAPWE